MHICEATGWPPPYPSSSLPLWFSTRSICVFHSSSRARKSPPSLSPVSVFCGHILKRLRDWLWCKQVKVHLTYRDIVVPSNPSTLQIVAEVTEITLCIGEQ